MVAGAPDNRFVFKGWVPNLDGSTSFSTFGTGMYSARVATANVGDSHHRYVISLQDKVLRDAILPPTEKLPRYLNKNSDGAFCLICVAKTDGRGGSGNNSLGGILCLVQRGDWLEMCRELIRNAQTELDAYQIEFPQLDGTDYVSRQFENTFKGLEDTLRTRADFVCKFNLEKTGIATITAPVTWRWHPFCQSEETRYEQRFVVCSQLFYFLKDLGHRHQHHSRRTDTICDLYPVGNNVHWKYETFRRLYLKMAEYEWRKSEEVYFSSLGVLSYLRSFYEIFGEDLKKYDLVDRARALTANMELSIKANEQTINRRLQMSSAKAGTFTTWMFGILAIVLSFIGLSQMVKGGVVAYEKVNHIIIALNYFILETPFYFIAAMAIIVFVVGVVVYKTKPLDTTAAFTAVRAVQGMPRLMAVLVLALTGILILALWFGLGRLIGVW